jgi:hypothetical protein
MGRDKKWASNDKMKLIVENFKKFMEEGDFSPEPEVNEGEMDDSADINVAARTMLKNIHAVKDKFPEQSKDAVTKIYAASFLGLGDEYSVPLGKLTEDWILGVMSKIPEENLMVKSNKLKTDDEGNLIQRKDYDREKHGGDQFELEADVFSESAYWYDEKRNRSNFPIVHEGSRVSPCPKSEIGYINPRGKATIDPPERWECYQGSKKYK